MPDKRVAVRIGVRGGAESGDINCIRNPWYPHLVKQGIPKTTIKGFLLEGINPRAKNSFDVWHLRDSPLANHP